MSRGIRLAKETVRKLMTDAGLWIPRRQRPPKVYQPQARRACLGELSVCEFATTGVGRRLRGIELDHGLVNQDGATGRNWAQTDVPSPRASACSRDAIVLRPIRSISRSSCSSSTSNSRRVFVIGWGMKASADANRRDT